MGRFIDGEWSSSKITRDEAGRFQRKASSFREWITNDGSSAYPATPGRYHLYVSLACPWAHRTLIVRRLRRLEDVVSISVTNHFMGNDAWTFDEAEGVVPDAVNGVRLLRDLYVKARPDYTGRVTVPILWDKETGAIVSNESREIARMFDQAFRAEGDPSVELYPPALLAEIEETIDALYQPVNNGVYRAGFAGSQLAYEEAVLAFFEALDHWEAVLSRRRFLCGSTLTGADICFFTTLLRFELVYYTHFKCNLRRLADYPNLFEYFLDIYQTPGVAETCDFEHIKRHYYGSHESVNPKRIVPIGPLIDFDRRHTRDRLG